MSKIGNLPHDKPESGLIELLSQAGKKNPDGTPSGFGFCEYDSPETAQNAVKILQGVKYNNRTLKIGYSDKTKSSRGDTSIPIESKSLKDLLKELVDSIPNRELTNIIRKWEDIRDHNSLYYDYMKDFPQLKRALQQFEQSFRNISSAPQKRKRGDERNSSSNSSSYYPDNSFSSYSQPPPQSLPPSKRYNTGQDYSYPLPYQYNNNDPYASTALPPPPPPSSYYYDDQSNIQQQQPAPPPSQSYTDPYSIPPMQQQQQQLIPPPPPHSQYYSSDNNVPDNNPYYAPPPPSHPNIPSDSNSSNNYKIPSDPRL